MRFKFRCNILISGKIIKEMPGSVVSGTFYIIGLEHKDFTILRIMLNQKLSFK